MFPPIECADDDGLLAFGGDLRIDTLQFAYGSGIFPWPVEGLPTLWFAPPRRAVLHFDDFHISRRLKRDLKKNPFEIRIDTDFASVIRACAAPRRDAASRTGKIEKDVDAENGDAEIDSFDADFGIAFADDAEADDAEADDGDDDASGTWISPAIIAGYERLHRRATKLELRAHSVEAYRDGALVGGLYGVSRGAYFCGESMFHRETNASKAALVALVEHLQDRGARWLDTQMMTPLFHAFGTHLIARDDFMAMLQTAWNRDVELFD